MKDFAEHYLTLTEDMQHPKFEFLEDDLFSKHYQSVTETISHQFLYPFSLLTLQDNNSALHAVHTSRLVLTFSKLNEAYIGSQFNFETDDMMMETIPEELAIAGFFADFGKFYIDSELLSKPEIPTSDEWEVLKEHITETFNLLDQWEISLSPIINRGIREHHERMDGTGYPNQKSGEEISLPGRILALCDVYCALTERRPYRPGNPPDVSLNIMESIMRHSSKFDQMLFDRLKKTIEFIKVKQSVAGVPDSFEDQVDTADFIRPEFNEPELTSITASLI